MKVYIPAAKLVSFKKMTGRITSSSFCSIPRVNINILLYFRGVDRGLHVSGYKPEQSKKRLTQVD